MKQREVRHNVELLPPDLRGEVPEQWVDRIARKTAGGLLPIRSARMGMCGTEPLRASSGGVLLLYHNRVSPNASTIMEHVNAFVRHSRYPVRAVNVRSGLPVGIAEFRPGILLLHYSLWGGPLTLTREVIDYSRALSAYKIAFLQDEYRIYEWRVSTMSEIGIDCLFTLFGPESHEAVYGSVPTLSRIETTIPGFVGEELVSAARRYRRPLRNRDRAVGYRGRELPWSVGKGGQEKTQIAELFAPHALRRGISIDIATAEDSRIYDDAWYKFVAGSRAVLGVESGTSVIDFDGTIEAEIAKIRARNPEVTFEDVFRAILKPHEDRLFYRTISPRHFEAAALGTVQILFEGHYSGILRAGDHYLPLKKDFSNVDEVIDKLLQDDACQVIIDRAYDDLIGSGSFTYDSFVSEHFDKVVYEETALEPAARRPFRAAWYTSLVKGTLSVAGMRHIGRRALSDLFQRLNPMAREMWLWITEVGFPARQHVVRLAKPLILPIAERLRDRMRDAANPTGH